MKAIEQDISVMLFIMLCVVVLTLKACGVTMYFEQAMPANASVNHKVEQTTV